MKLEHVEMVGAPPEAFRLAEVAALMAECGTTLTADPKLGQIELDGVLPDWAVMTLSLHYRHLVFWWRSSPSALLVCDTCGQWKFSDASAKGDRCFMGSERRWQGHKITWGCQGKFRLIVLPWTKRRPNRKRIKVAVAA